MNNLFYIIFMNALINTSFMLDFNRIIFLSFYVFDIFHFQL